LKWGDRAPEKSSPGETPLHRHWQGKWPKVGTLQSVLIFMRESSGLPRRNAALQWDPAQSRPCSGLQAILFLRWTGFIEIHLFDPGIGHAGGAPLSRGRFSAFSILRNWQTGWKKCQRINFWWKTAKLMVWREAKAFREFHCFPLRKQNSMAIMQCSLKPCTQRKPSRVSRWKQIW
jgi:hypothetical protein